MKSLEDRLIVIARVPRCTLTTLVIPFLFSDPASGPAPLQAFKALRLLLEQQYLSRCSSSCTTDGVRVDVTSKYDQV